MGAMSVGAALKDQGEIASDDQRSRETNQIRSLTSLRWFTALYVYVFHIAIRVENIPVWLRPIVDNGYVGMSFFFILSGFVLSISNFEGMVDKPTFIINRLSRIYPAYIAAVWYTSPSFRTMIDSSVLTVNALCNLFLLQAWMPNLFPLGINSGMWSLSVEIFFYASFPLMLPHIVSLSTNARMALLVLILLWLASFIPGYVEYLIPSNRAGLLYYYSSPIYRLPEFIVGMLLGVLWKQKKLCKMKFIAVAASACVYIYSCFVYDGMARQNQTLLNMTAVPAIATLLVYAVQTRPSVLEWRPLVYLGEISYGFYVYQFIFFGFMYKHALKVTGNIVAVTIYGIFVTSLIASVSFHFFEQPMRIAVRWCWKKRLWKIYR